MGENTQVRQLYRDALSGKLNRREVFQRGIALGLSANVDRHAGPQCGQGSECVRGRRRQANSDLLRLDAQPPSRESPPLGEEQGVDVQTAPTENFGFDRFIAEGHEKNSTWDFYGGVTPFLEMIALVDSGTIEPWDPVRSGGSHRRFRSGDADRGNLQGSVLRLAAAARHLRADAARRYRREGRVSIRKPPRRRGTSSSRTRQKVMDSGAAPYGIVFDHRDWRSLIPVTHSISTDVYDTETGLFQYASDAGARGARDPEADDAADIRTSCDGRRCRQHRLAGRGRLRRRAGRVLLQVPECRLPVLGQLAGSELSCASAACRRPRRRRRHRLLGHRRGALQVWREQAEGRRVPQALSKDEQMWQDSSHGQSGRRHDPGRPAAGSAVGLGRVGCHAAGLVRGQSVGQSVFDSLGERQRNRPVRSSAIKQFDAARPEWHKYLSGEEPDAKTAGQKAQDAALAEYEKNATPTASAYAAATTRSDRTSGRPVA